MIVTGILSNEYHGLSKGSNMDLVREGVPIVGAVLPKWTRLLTGVAKV